MKKLYTLLVAAAVTLSAAATSFKVNKDQLSERTISEFKTMAIGSVDTYSLNFNKTRRAPAKQETKAPEDLATLTDLSLCYNLTMSDGSDYLTSPVTFTLQEEQQGYKLYQMNGLLEGVFNSSVTVLPLLVIYDAEQGLLCLPSGQDFIKYGGSTFTTWNVRDNGYLYPGIHCYFNWDGTGFTLENPVELEDSNGMPMEFTTTGLYVGQETTSGVSGLFQISDLAFKKKTGTWSAVATLSTGQAPFEEAVFTKVTGNELIMDGFFMYANIHFTIDSEAKTLTATNQSCGLQNFGTDNNPEMVEVFLSEADNSGDFPVNKYNVGEYKLVMTYTLENGKTNITCPDWNVFAALDDNGFMDDYNGLVPFSNTKITLDFELSAQSGLDKVAVDANAPVEYYNLQGVRVANPSNGLYIKHQGNTATKVLVK